MKISAVKIYYFVNDNSYSYGNEVMPMIEPLISYKFSVIFTETRLT